MKKITLGLAVAALLAISAATAMTASAAAIIIRGTETTPTFEAGLTDDCRPGLTGTLVGTNVMSFQSVEIAQGFHTDVTNGGPGRIDWSDGSYTLIDAVDRFSFNAVGQGTEVFTETHTDGADFYSAAGVFQFRRTFPSNGNDSVSVGGTARCLRWREPRRWPPFAMLSALLG